jgi:hypothetical protein
MSCRSCRSENQTEFASEICVHHPGLEKVDKPAVMLFPKLRICMKCGFTEFKMHDTELRLLGESSADDGSV